MLIEIDRAASSFQLAHGWWAGRYWRAVITDTDEGTICRDVYIQVLLPVKILEPGASYFATIPAQHHADIVLLVGGYCVSPHDSGLRYDWKWLWVEVYYGSQHILKRTGKWSRGEIQISWYPFEARGDAAFTYVLPKTFLKCIQPAAHYLCEQFVLMETDPNYVERIRSATATVYPRMSREVI